MKNVNIVCTSKPGDGLLHYSYEHCCFLNDLGFNAKLVIVRHHKFTQQDYINALNECYVKYENVIFDSYIPRYEDITLIMGRSMLTLPYLYFVLGILQVYSNILCRHLAYIYPLNK